MPTFKSFTRRLASLLVAGPMDAEALHQRVQSLVSRKRAWTRRLAQQIHERYTTQRRPRLRELETLLAHNPLVVESFEKDLEFLCDWQPQQSLFVIPQDERLAWPVPRWNSVSELRELLELEPSEFDWFADRKGLERFAADESLRHYRYRWIRKRGGTARLIEAPKLRLKALQRRILDEVFTQIPAHEAAHGFRVGRSISSFVAPHVGRTAVLRMDLKDFFPSINPCRMRSLLMTCGYAEEVAVALTFLCTNRVPMSVFKDFPFPENRDAKRSQSVLLRQSHLPQGAPTSPQIANLCAFRFDCRLTGLARWAGATYTRYADDLLFSGDANFARCSKRFAIYVGAIALEEGFEINTHKTRLMRSSIRQTAGGVVLNEKAQTPRVEFDTLKAILHRCVHLGPSTQNRDEVPRFREHLAGRVAYVAQWNSARGAKLTALWEQIDWSR